MNQLSKLFCDSLNTFQGLSEHTNWYAVSFLKMFF